MVDPNADAPAGVAPAAGCPKAPNPVPGVVAGAPNALVEGALPVFVNAELPKADVG